MAASMPLPGGLSKGEYVGSLAGHALEAVKCDTNDLYVPANSDIVFEGSCSISEKAPEGRFGKLHGYVFPGTPMDELLYRVDLTTHRKDAILPVSNCGRLADERYVLFACGSSVFPLLSDGSWMSHTKKSCSTQ
jgi:UbiD family decarboxylase